MALSAADYFLIKDLLDNMEERMGAREDAAYEKLNATIVSVKEGWAELKAENEALKAQLAEAGQALDADSEADAEKVETADAALSELLDAADTEEPPAEPTA